MSIKTIPDLYFGTAMWGWTLDKAAAFKLLDYFYAAGFRKVDTATNYPINKKPEDFRKAELLLAEWTKVNGVNDLQIVVKVGSLNNMRTPDHELSKSFLLMNLDFYQKKFGANLHSFMVHWDNRNNLEEVFETVNVLQLVSDQGLQPGLSGIKHPELYFSEAMPTLSYDIQVKHNLLKSDISRYDAYIHSPCLITYGINAGGVKLESDSYRPNSTLKARGGSIDNTPPMVEKLNQLLPEINSNNTRPNIEKFNELGLIYAFHHPKVKGILIGPSRIDQLEETFGFYDYLKQGLFNDVYLSLQKLNP